jgi:hydroxypyruvate isomerase
MHLRYAINVGTHFTNHPMLDRLQKVADLGFQAVENNGLPDLERPAGSPEPNYDAIAAYGQKLKQLGLSQATWVTNGCAGKCNCAITDSSGVSEFLRRVRHTAKIAPLVDGTISTVTSGVDVPGLSQQDMTRHVIEALKQAADIVEKAGGPILVLEPLNVLVDHPGYHVVKSDHAAEIIDAVGSPKVKILFDIYHQQISEGNLIGNIRKYYDRIGYFQFGDHPGRHEPFTGEIHYPNVFKAIYQLGYQGMVGGEYGPVGGGNDEASIASIEAVRRADQW